MPGRQQDDWADYCVLSNIWILDTVERPGATLHNSVTINRVNRHSLFQHITLELPQGIAQSPSFELRASTLALYILPCACLT